MKISNVERKFISLYFKNGITKERKKSDVTISFKGNDPLYEKCKKLGSSGIKKELNIYSYKELLKKANEEERPVSNYIKYKLRKKLMK